MKREYEEQGISEEYNEQRIHTVMEIKTQIYITEIRGASLKIQNLKSHLLFLDNASEKLVRENQSIFSRRAILQQQLEKTQTEIKKYQQMIENQKGICAQSREELRRYEDFYEVQRSILEEKLVEINEEMHALKTTY